MIGWTYGSLDRLSSHLLSNIEVQTPDKPKELGDYGLAHAKVPRTREHPVIDMAPFTADKLPSGYHLRIPLRVNGNWYWCTWKAVVYLMSKGSLPVWYQLSLTINQEFRDLAALNSDVYASENDLLEIQRLSGKRPVVAWDGISVG